jgi:glucan phosphoethanolaminetransferase (alkaline phosphatase superfamily)
MIAYRDLLSTMIIIFSILTIVMMPAFFFFQKYDGIRPSVQKSFVKYSLGNMGYSSAQCSLIPLGAGDFADYI